MALAIAIAVVALLLAGFLFLTALEGRRGARVMPGARAALDAAALRAAATLSSGRILTSAAHAASIASRHAVHEVVHIVLIVIRAIERTLTRIVRAIRESNALHLEKSRKKEPSPAETTQAGVE